MNLTLPAIKARPKQEVVYRSNAVVTRLSRFTSGIGKRKMGGTPLAALLKQRASWIEEARRLLGS